MDAADLVEIEQIKQLKARYFRCMDTKTWDAMRDVFSVDCRLHWGPNDGDVWSGRDTIVDNLAKVLEGAVTVHHGHMPEIEITGPDSARGTWAMFDWVDYTGAERGLKGYGHYLETYEKRDDQWRIKTSQLTRLRVDAYGM